MKKLLSLILIVILCFALFACSDDNNNEEISATTADSATQDTTATTAPLTTTENPTTQVTTSNITEQEALKIAERLVGCYSMYENFGTVCETQNILDSEEWDNVYALLTEEQTMYMGTILRCVCCKTPEQAIEHVYNCIDTSLAESMYMNKDYVSYNGNLYVMLGAVGAGGCENVRIKSYTDNVIVAYADSLTSYDEVYSTLTLTIENIDGTYKITSVTEKILQA